MLERRNCTVTSSLTSYLQNSSGHIKWQLHLDYQLSVFSLKISEGTRRNDAPNNHWNLSNPAESPRFLFDCYVKLPAWSQLPVVHRHSIKGAGHHKTHSSPWLRDSKKSWQTLQAQRMNFTWEYKQVPMTAAPMHEPCRHHPFPWQPIWHCTFERGTKPEYTSCCFKYICCVNSGLMFWAATSASTSTYRKQYWETAYK